MENEVKLAAGAMVSLAVATAALVVLLVLLFLTPALAHVPRAVLAAVVLLWAGLKPYRASLEQLKRWVPEAEPVTTQAQLKTA